jgi:hypothetical protein
MDAFCFFINDDLSKDVKYLSFLYFYLDDFWLLAMYCYFGYTLNGFSK